MVHVNSKSIFGDRWVTAKVLKRLLDENQVYMEITCSIGGVQTINYHFTEKL